MGKHVLTNNVPAAISRFHLKPIHPLPPTNHLNLAIGLPLRNQDELNRLLKEIYDPASTNYHHYLTPEQFTERFGPTEQDYKKVIAFAETNGLTVTATYPNRTLLDVQGSAAKVEKAFHVTLQVYQHPSESRTFYAPSSEPSVNVNIPISHVSGLDNYTIPRPAIIKKKLLNNEPAGAPPASGSGPGGLYIGNDFRAAYAPDTSLSGVGQTVGLLELDGYYTSDIVTYENQAGLANVLLTNIFIDGYSGLAGGNNVEVALDIEVAIAMAPGISRVIVYEEQNGGNIVDMLNRMVSDNLAKQISSSWIIGNNASYDTAYKQMAAQGQSFFQASGDDDAYYNGIAQWADDTNITLVGGTTLTMTGAGGAYSSEKVWNWYSTGEGTSGSGGGTNFHGVQIPIWQTGIDMTTNQGSTTLRNIPDVALTADAIFVVADNGVHYSVGGTSAAAPLWAGFAALINQQASVFNSPNVGFLNPAIYAIGKSAGYSTNFHDITIGNNTNATVKTKYFAAPGYDLCTGWGTPRGQNLIDTLVTPDTLKISPLNGLNANGPVGGPFSPVSQDFHLTNSTAGAITWSLINTSSWLNVSSSSGTLTAGSADIVTVSLTAAVNSFPVGTYGATIRFTNSVSHVTQSFPFILHVMEPLTISPSGGFTAYGPAGGPFSVTSQNFTLSNIGAAALNWRIGNTSAWLNVTPASGTLSAAGQAAVVASLKSAASNLAAGTFTAKVFFTNQTSGNVQSRLFTLSIGQSLVQNGGFETGDFSNWTLDEPDNIYSIVDNGSSSYITPHGGTYCAALGHPSFQGYLSQTLFTIPGQIYLLSLWFDSPDVAAITGGYFTSNTPNEFSVSWNGATLFDQTNIPGIGWTNLLFAVQATSSSTVLKFGERVDPWYLGLDDVTVFPLLPTVFQATAETNGHLQFSWNASTGLVYQVQYKTNLLQPNWLVLKNIKATNSSILFVDTNSITRSPQKFYRLLLSP